MLFFTHLRQFSDWVDMTLFNKEIPVVQEDITGCSIACVSWMCGQSYTDIKALAVDHGISIEDPRLWSATDHVRTILKKVSLNAKSEEVEFNNWDSLPAYSLLAIKYHLEKGIPHWHWVVCVNNHEDRFIMDPKKSLKSNIRTDFGRIKPKWYIEITV